MYSRYDSIVRSAGDGLWRACCDCGWHSAANSVYRVVQLATKKHRAAWCPYRHQRRANSRLPVRRGAGARKRSGGAAPPH
jgi:hypothetical protein